MLEIRNIRKSFGSTEVLKGIDLTVKKGDVVAIIGPSGSGKTTLLRCMNFLESAGSGTMVFDHDRYDLGHISKKEIARLRKKTAFVFQNYNLFLNRTALQNVMEGLVTARKMPKAQAEETARLALQKVGMLDWADYYPRQLSGGQQQRAALARILASEPRAILLDEPFSALDGYLKWQLEQELGDVLGRFGGPVVWVSHDLGEVYRNCRRVCVLSGGRSTPAAALRELMADPGTVSAARISGCEVFVPVRPGAEEGTVFVPAWALTLPAAPWREGVTTLGVRAEGVRPAADGFPCRVVRATEDVSVMRIALRPEGAAAESPLLQMALGKAEWAALPDRQQVRVAIRPADMLLLKGEL